MKIVPAVNAKSWREFVVSLLAFWKEKIVLQIDVFGSDYCGVHNYVSLFWLNLLRGQNQIEYHLMTKKPDNILLKYLKTKPTRLSIDPDEMLDYDYCYSLCQKHNCQFGFFLREGQVLDPSWKFDFLIIMGVEPGTSGRSQLDSTVERVKKYREMYPTVLLGVDGGVKPDNLNDFSDLDFICMGSAIFNTSNPLQTFKELQQLNQ